ncbi:MAG: putative PhzF superfamily epimerase YddE/YHI9 [Flavobacterium sp.]|jgi:predicted PhzF superfamily epimerase YddE/YHI9
MNVFIIDSFTNEAFKGNPAGVCLLKSDISAKKMQAIASELNLSETAFLNQVASKETEYAIRYFSPTVEIPFCGHATLAASKMVLHHLKKSEVSFTTFHNLKLSAISNGKSIVMKFPLFNTIDYLPNAILYESLGIPNSVVIRFSKDLEMVLIEVQDKELLQNIKPDFTKMIQSSDTLKGVIVTAKSQDKNYDFYSRCFCPWIGINEDPVTGSSHSVLAKYWSNILNKTEFSAFQLSKRGGFMQLKILSETELEVTSEAKIVFEGILNLE